MRTLFVLVLVGCGGGESLPTHTVSVETKPELRRCGDGEVCPVMGDPSGPGRCEDTGLFCNQVIANFTSEPAGLRCGTDEGAVDCVAEFEAGSTVTIRETHQGSPGSCPIFGCRLRATADGELGPSCGESFAIDRDYTLTFACIAP